MLRKAGLGLQMGTQEIKEYPEKRQLRTGQDSHQKWAQGLQGWKDIKKSAMPSETQSFCGKDEVPTVTARYNQQARATLWPDEPAPVKPGWRPPTS